MPMTPLDSFRQTMEQVTAHFTRMLPLPASVLLPALVQATDRVALGDDAALAARPGWNLALRLCLEQQEDQGETEREISEPAASQAACFLSDCDQLASASLVLAQCTAGYLQVQQRASHCFVAWATSRRLTPEQRESADIDWWTARLSRLTAPRLSALLNEGGRLQTLPGQSVAAIRDADVLPMHDQAVEHYYRQLGATYVARFACQHSYPTNAQIGGATFGQYAEILALLIGWRFLEHDRLPTGSMSLHLLWPEKSLIAALAAALDADEVEIATALQPFMLNNDNAAYHSILPSRAAPPLIRLGKQVIPSALGLLGAPFVFLARDLRHRYTQEYHNNAHLREGVFRDDLYRLFEDKRFVVSPGRVELRRSGQAQTDLDALVFDRKTGTLGVFELKAQDPFARTVQERQRQRDYFLQANRQVAVLLDWVQRRGPDDVLARFGERTAKRFHVQKVYVFVLGRYLAPIEGTPEPDRRVAWASWPQVLQAAENGVLDPGQRNPLGTLFVRLRSAEFPTVSAHSVVQDIAIGDLQLRIYPSFSTMRREEEQRA